MGVKYSNARFPKVRHCECAAAEIVHSQPTFLRLFNQIGHLEVYFFQGFLIGIFDHRYDKPFIRVHSNADINRRVSNEPVSSQEVENNGCFLTPLQLCEKKYLCM